MFHDKVRFGTFAKKNLLTRSVQFVLIEYFILGYLTRVYGAALNGSKPIYMTDKHYFSANITVPGTV